MPRKSTSFIQKSKQLLYPYALVYTLFFSVAFSFILRVNGRYRCCFAVCVISAHVPVHSVVSSKIFDIETNCICSAKNHFIQFVHNWFDHTFIVMCSVRLFRSNDINDKKKPETSDWYFDSGKELKRRIVLFE